MSGECVQWWYLVLTRSPFGPAVYEEFLSCIGSECTTELALEEVSSFLVCFHGSWFYSQREIKYTKMLITQREHFLTAGNSAKTFTCCAYK